MKKLMNQAIWGVRVIGRCLQKPPSAGPAEPTRGWMLIGVVCLVILATGTGCSDRKKPEGSGSVTGIARDSSLPDIKYARGFRMERSGRGILLILSDPRNRDREIARYRLNSGGTRPEPVPGVTDIFVPVKKLVASSTTHAGFLSAIGAGDRLDGCNNPERLYDTVLYNRYREGRLVQTGRDLSYNLEVLISLHPGLVLQTGIDGQFRPDPRLTDSGIPVMLILEWMEPTPLGRAEWVKVFGRITGRSRQADSLFGRMERRYIDLVSRGKEAKNEVKVLTGNVFKGTWYMPGGRNYMTRFFEDAGMDYPWKDTDSSGSLPLSFETVVYRMADAPVWINVNVDTLSQLLNSEKRYSVFRALKDHRVFSLSNRVNDHGGNDFWESAVVRPDLVLADLLAIAHPELEPGHVWNYYKPLVYNK